MAAARPASTTTLRPTPPLRLASRGRRPVSGDQVAPLSPHRTRRPVHLLDLRAGASASDARVGRHVSPSVLTAVAYRPA